MCPLLQVNLSLTAHILWQLSNIERRQTEVIVTLSSGIMAGSKYYFGALFAFLLYLQFVLHDVPFADLLTIPMCFNWLSAIRRHQSKILPDNLPPRRWDGCSWYSLANKYGASAAAQSFGDPD